MTEKKKDDKESVADDAVKKTSQKSVKKEHSSSEENACGSCGDESTGNGIFVWLIVIMMIIGVVIFVSQKNSEKKVEAKPVSDKVSEEVSANALKLIEDKLVMPGTEVKIISVMEESGLYKIDLTVAEQEVTSYMTKDKTKFIPQLIDIEELNATEEENEEATQDVLSAEVQTKTDKPKIELFIMSYCPYGTQIEKGILPVLDKLGNSVDAEFKFVDYAMHGEKEVKEQLKQYCIQKNMPNQFVNYLDCFLASTSGSEEEATSCMTKLQINQSVVAQCENTTDVQYQITALLEDKSSWVNGQFPQFNIYKEEGEKYGVQGSPTLVINGEVVQTGRDSESLLETICSAFNDQPEVCQEEMSSVTPSPGFGTGTDESGTSADAGCGA